MTLPRFVASHSFLLGIVVLGMPMVHAQSPAPRAPAAPAPEAGPAVPKDAVSLGLLQKAKKLAAQFGSIKEAKLAIDALSQLMD